MRTAQGIGAAWEESLLETGRRVSVAVVEPLRTVRSNGRVEPERVSGVLLLEFVDPVSPELALVDPELAAEARALLPDGPGIRIAGRRETIELIPFSVPAIPVGRRIRPAPVIASILLGAALVAGIGAGVALSVLDREPAAQSSAPVAAPTMPPTQVSPAPRPPTVPPSRSGPNVVEPPRFVWPAEPGVERYRVALYRGGQQIFERDVRATALELPRAWMHEGRAYDLTRGTYRWVVWPLFRSGEGSRLGPAIVSANYTV